MTEDFDRILDDCLDRLNRGDSVEACLAAYPEQAGELEPLLQARKKARRAYDFTPSDAARRAARQRFYAALEKRHTPSFWEQLRGRKAAWVTVTGTLVFVLIAGLVTARMVFPNEPAPGATSVIPTLAVTAPAAEGNFAFLVSDEVNAIADFSRLDVTVDKVGLRQSDAPGRWVEFQPETAEFDLVRLPGTATQELWRGNVPEGDYAEVILYISTIVGTLKDSREVVDIKLPGGKLNLPCAFTVSPDSVTSFIYDITVFRAGNSGKYILKPQAAESGATQTPAGKAKDKTPGKPT